MNRDVEISAECLQHVGELARQNALLTAYRSNRVAGRTHIEGVPIRDLELHALLVQQDLLRGLDELLPLLIAGPAYPPHQGPEQAAAWEEVVQHPALQPAHDTDGPLLDAVLSSLTEYERSDDARVDAEDRLARIRALCPESRSIVWVSDVRRILDGPAA